MKKVKSTIRLYKTFQPVTYKLILAPNLTTFLFDGQEEIALTLAKPTKKIILNSLDIIVKKAEVSANGETQAAKISYNKTEETVIFSFPKALSKNVVLTLSFEGKLNDKMHGFYRSKYLAHGVEQYMATTQFESTSARMCFPCIDEPMAKAVFLVTLVVPQKLTTISNTPIASEVATSEGKKQVTFTPTPKMSTYLLAFIVGEFEYTEKRTKEGTQVRVYVTPGKKEQAVFGLDVATKTLSFFNEYFGIPYPLPKMDFIAIPDFAAGAMENWGAVTYRETAILVDPKNSSTASKQWVALVIAHELAHQWFGNLVTMEWWTDLWLNEGFASYIEYVAVDHLFPEWDIWTQFVHLDLGRALELDALQHTHPIEVTVRNPSEISEIFDAVSYSKGASILRMLAEYIGEDAFRKGLGHYLNKYKYGNAKTSNLWESLETTAKKPVKKVMEQWTKKPGYPLIEVLPTSKGINLSQERFFINVASKKHMHDKTIWPIPVAIQTSASSKTEKLLFDKKTATVVFSQKNTWLKANAGESSVVRILYERSLLLALKNPIEKKQLTPVDRLGIIRDAFVLSQAGYTATAHALQLANSYKKETDYTVWSELSSFINALDDLYSNEPFYDLFTRFAASLYKDIAATLGWNKKPNESHTTTLLRTLVLYQLAKFGDKATLKKAKDLFDQHMQQKKEIDPDIRGIVYAFALKSGGEKTYNQLLQLYKAATLQEEKNRIARAFGYAKEKDLIQKTLTFAFSPYIRSQDACMVVASVWANPNGREMAWEFTKSHWDEIVSRFGGGGHLLPRFVQPISQVVDDAMHADIISFFNTHKVPEIERTVAQVLETIEANRAWLQRDKASVATLLTEQL